MPTASASSPWIGGRFLVATPAMPDPRFAGSVIFMCEHNPEGALGLIVNKAIDDLPLAEVLKQLDIVAAADCANRPVHFGGPVQTERGLVLHSTDYRRSDTLVVDQRFALTSSLEILRDIASGQGPARSLLALGHSGWGAGQLDRELQDNAWLVIADDDEMAFGADLDGKWQKAMSKLGAKQAFDPAAFSHLTGRA